MYKKIFALLLVLTMVLSLGITGCGKKVDEPKETPAPVETPEEPTVEAISVGLVTDIGGIDDKSFNQGTWEGIKRFAEDTGASTDYLQSESDTDYIPNLSTFSDEAFDLIVAPGFLFEDSLTEVSANFPDQKYLIIDMVINAPNVASAVFAEEQGSFLVGVAAALKSQEAGKDTVGFIGGMDFDLIQKFEAGFEAGVKAVDPEMNVLIEYAGSFADAQKGQTLAAKMYNEGAYVIYHAAGATGNGLIKEAKDRATNGQEVWAIGVDKDQYEDGIYDGTKSVILTSMMKRVDVAAYDVAEMTMKGEFPGGEILAFTLENSGVGIPAENPNLSAEIVAKVTEFEGKVKSGEIVVPTAPVRLAQ
ncbi:MAG: BMP family ABC transporter substrate-binding protein [Firmicutes bacterium HGW-Firmicutes-1]|jgi:basic membrane protein A|nr:MAG: BMP family ABC transporter substrate-binding protein [Firmicutes bacterium HGW-Firmicutes-1]